MRSMNVALALLQLVLTGSSLSAQPADASQESKTRQIKIWTNDDLEQLLSQGFTPKVPSEKVWSNADLFRFRDEGVISKAPAEKVWTNSDLKQRLSQPPVAKKPGEKVWTNPDLDRLRDQGLISIIGPVEEKASNLVRSPGRIMKPRIRSGTPRRQLPSTPNSTTGRRSYSASCKGCTAHATTNT